MVFVVFFVSCFFCIFGFLSFHEGVLRSWLTLREEGQVELLGRRLTDLARALVCQPLTDNVKYSFLRTLSGVT
jgi:hypothetical protein